MDLSNIYMARDKKYWIILHRLCKEGKINSSYVYKSINNDQKFYFPHIIAVNYTHLKEGA